MMTISNRINFRQIEYIENKNDLLKVLKQINNNDEYIKLREIIINFLLIRNDCSICVNDILCDNCNELFNYIK